MNSKLKAAKEILPLLELFIPEVDRKKVINQLESLIEIAEEKPDNSKIVEQILDLLWEYEETKKWMEQKLATQTDILSVSRGGNEIDQENKQSYHYRVWFGTNREPIDINDLSQGFTGNRSQIKDAVYYGHCMVNIPETHQFGETGRAWWRRWASFDFRGDDHLTIKEINGCSNEADFWSQLQQSFSASDETKKESLIFLHGFNNSFEEAAIRASQIGFDLKVQGEMAFFSWPSEGSVSSYMIDEGNILWSEKAITDFLVHFIEKSGAEKVHLIAHSMGNRGLLGALQNITQQVSLAHKEIKFGQIILAAPDLDVALFQQAKQAYINHSNSLTLYTSRRDLPVLASEKLHKYPRLGKVPPITIEEGMTTILVNNFDIFNLGHGYFSEAAALLHDIYDLIQHGTLAQNRQRLRKKQSKEDVYWELVD